MILAIVFALGGAVAIAVGVLQFFFTGMDFGAGGPMILSGLMFIGAAQVINCLVRMANATEATLNEIQRGGRQAEIVQTQIRNHEQ